ncbi:MAG: hypothetical protein ABJX32_07680 [Tateyamaria sp.]|uniref:hypothetical protein n=1 Tax=Tateyamaria sp. TaxID=1929288 RepID=UPI00329E3009
MLTFVPNAVAARNSVDVLCGEALQVGRALACFDVRIFCPSAESRPQAAAPSTGRPPACRYFNQRRFARIEDVLGCHKVLPWIGWIDIPRPVDGAAQHLAESLGTVATA